MPGQTLTTIGFDADDTLWHNERFFRGTQALFADLLRDHADPETLDARLLAAEKRNIGRYGYGIKGFVLSMIETAIEVTDDRVPAAVIRQIIEAGHQMLAHPVDLLPHARETVQALAGDFRLLLITKGDLLHQERKLAQSGLGDLFDGVEIISDKTDGHYDQIFAHHGDGAARGLMAGNSMRSDVLPMIAAGGQGVHVPQDLAWPLEHADPPVDHPRFHEIPDLSGLEPLIRALNR